MLLPVALVSGGTTSSVHQLSMWRSLKRPEGRLTEPSLILRAKSENLALNMLCNAIGCIGRIKGEYISMQQFQQMVYNIKLNNVLVNG